MVVLSNCTYAALSSLSRFIEMLGSEASLFEASENLETNCPGLTMPTKLMAKQPIKRLLN